MEVAVLFIQHIFLGEVIPKLALGSLGIIKCFIFIPGNDSFSGVDGVA